MSLVVPVPCGDTYDCAGPVRLSVGVLSWSSGGDADLALRVGLPS
jgi:hypothetical protein